MQKKKRFSLHIRPITDWKSVNFLAKNHWKSVNFSQIFIGKV
jgi:hypothetical protein